MEQLSSSFGGAGGTVNCVWNNWGIAYTYLGREYQLFQVVLQAVKKSSGDGRFQFHCWKIAATKKAAKLGLDGSYRLFLITISRHKQDFTSTLRL